MQSMPYGEYLVDCCNVNTLSFAVDEASCKAGKAKNFDELSNIINDLYSYLSEYGNDEIESYEQFEDLMEKYDKDIPDDMPDEEYEAYCFKRFVEEDMENYFAQLSSEAQDADDEWTDVYDDEYERNGVSPWDFY